ncbi:hypothetical protein R1sor_012407 [Riccia sorocarpa]|uniref:Uncharacterized protein n=1 Tax=Riccia sorocarpa TaxID=122646 RepID=A0ABD3I4F7_9MARC
MTDHGEEALSDSTTTQEIISQLRKLSVAAGPPEKATEDRDRAIQSRVAVVRSALLVHYPWTAIVEDSNFSPVEKPTNVEIKNCPTWAKDLIPDIFAAIAPVLRISPAARNLLVENPRATILWDPSKPRPRVVSLEIEEDDNSSTFQFPVKFIDLPELSDSSQPRSPSGGGNDPTPSGPAAETHPRASSGSTPSTALFHSSRKAKSPTVASVQEPLVEEGPFVNTFAIVPFVGPLKTAGSSSLGGDPCLQAFDSAPIITELVEEDSPADSQRTPQQQPGKNPKQSIREVLAARRKVKRRNPSDIQTLSDITSKRRKECKDPASS